MDNGDLLVNKYIEQYDHKTIFYNNVPIQYCEYIQKVAKSEQVCAKYFILKIDECFSDAKEILVDEINAINEIQELILSEDFFRSNSDLKFNLYMILVVSDYKKSDELYKMQTDYHYGRKIIVTESILNCILNTSYMYTRLNQKPDSMTLLPSELCEIDKGLKLAKIIRQINLESFYYKPSLSLFDKIMQRFYLKKHDEFNPYTFLDTAKLRNSIDIKLTYPKQESMMIKSIKELQITDFRNFGSTRTIPFAQINLVLGDNGNGKTSVLEAIEYAITKKIRKYEDFGSDEGLGSAKLVVKNSEHGEFEISSIDTNSCALINAWYKQRIDKNDIEKSNTMLNNCFLKFNYFDTRGAFRFALSNRDTTETCDREIEIMELIAFDTRYIRQIEFIKEYDKLLEERNMILSQDKLEIDRQIYKLQNRNGKKNPVKPKIEMYSDEFLCELWEKDIRRPNNLVKECGITQTIEALTRIKNAYNKQENKNNEFRKRIAHIEPIESLIEKMISMNIKEIEKFFLLLNLTKEYRGLVSEQHFIFAIRTSDDAKVSISHMSTGQRVCLALSIMFTLYKSNEDAPNLIILDEPMANLDNLHILNLIDILRGFALSGTQIFFSTSNSSIARLFRRKFSFFQDEFESINVNQINQGTEITIEKYSSSLEAPISCINV